MVEPYCKSCAAQVLTRTRLKQLCGRGRRAGNSLYVHCSVNITHSNMLHLAPPAVSSCTASAPTYPPALVTTRLRDIKVNPNYTGKQTLNAPSSSAERPAPPRLPDRSSPRSSRGTTHEPRRCLRASWQQTQGPLEICPAAPSAAVAI